jgi:hypothetical protein
MEKQSETKDGWLLLALKKHLKHYTETEPP